MEFEIEIEGLKTEVSYENDNDIAIRRFKMDWIDLKRLSPSFQARVKDLVTNYLIQHPEPKFDPREEPEYHEDR